ncbi:MAG: hypothetical protein KGJ23_01480 [Euryarchaeota archaeon]|nr:hypothetical protein [Euryarchaeota archaeon]MDE1835266.1 hypothetical protein [Euryarchaeota archaeon]MDE1882240.1 hypothetical protein [Euryarchaeota archaeon]MDE2043562.1 hypothetical protein [Thermoplasmata archaeon]
MASLKVPSTKQYDPSRGNLVRVYLLGPTPAVVTRSPAPGLRPDPRSEIMASAASSMREPSSTLLPLSRSRRSPRQLTLDGGSGQVPDHLRRADLSSDEVGEMAEIFESAGIPAPRSEPEGTSTRADQALPPGLEDMRMAFRELKRKAPAPP